MANVDPPIAIIAPDYFASDPVATEFIHSSAQSDILVHCGKCFDREFEDFADLQAFLKNLKDPEALQQRLALPDRLLFDSEWKSLPLEEQLDKYKNETLGRFQAGTFDPQSTGDLLWMMWLGRMMQTNEIVFKAHRLRGTAVLDAPTSWQYLLWKYEYDHERSSKSDPELKGEFIVNALQSEDLNWLGNISAEDLVHLREEGALMELRGLLGEGIQEIENADIRNFTRTVETVIGNIEAAITEHSRKLKELSTSGKKFLGYQVTPWMAKVGISVATLVSGNIPLTVLSEGLGHVMNVPSAKDLWSTGSELVKKRSDLKKSPVALLVEAKESPDTVN